MTTPIDDWLEPIEASARDIGLTAHQVAVVAARARAIAHDPRLAEGLGALHRALLEEPPSEAIARVKARDLPATLGLTAARETLLVLALSQLRAARARHGAQGVADDISRATLSDIALWVLHFELQTGAPGITVEILDWAQRYLRGDLFRIGVLQFDLRPFGGPIRAYRHRRDRTLRLTLLDGREIDPRTGDPFADTSTRPALESDDAWMLVADPSSPILDMHIPAGTKLDERQVAHAIRDGLAFFAARRPEITPVGAAGEAWLLDPQMQFLLPKNAGLHAIQADCCLYPSSLPEAKTLRRLFGPDITREHLPMLPRDRMTSLLRAVVDHLAVPENTLRARGGLLLREELDAILARV
ncbi:MAG: acyltransferase domain-containing protein [Sandaracinus sp.]